MIIFSVFLLHLPQRFARSLAFLLDVQGQSAGEWAQQTFFPIRTEEARVVPAFRARLYRPRIEGKTAGLVLIPGLHPKGIDEPRFEVLARAIARQGVTVLAPDITDFRRFQVTEQAIGGIVRAVQFMIEKRTDVDAEKVGLFGISYSAGPALIAACRKEIAGKIAFVVSVGGYYNLTNPIEYVLTGSYFIEGRQILLPPHPWGRMIFALNNLDLIAPREDRRPLEEALRCYLRLDEAGAKRSASCLSHEGRELLALITGPIKPQLYGRMSGALARVASWSDRLSPEIMLTPAALQRLRARIYLLHGAKDSVIPCSETWQLAQALAQRHHPAHRVLITKGLTHVDSAEKSLSWYERLIESAKLVTFLMALFNEK